MRQACHRRLAMQIDAKADRSSSVRSRSLESAVLARLIEEVRNEDLGIARSYDRTHNRHNR